MSLLETFTQKYYLRRIRLYLCKRIFVALWTSNRVSHFPPTKGFCASTHGIPKPKSRTDNRNVHDQRNESTRFSHSAHATSSINSSINLASSFCLVSVVALSFSLFHSSFSVWSNIGKYKFIPGYDKMQTNGDFFDK